MKVIFVIYASRKSLHEKKDTCHSNPEKKSSTMTIENTLYAVIHYLWIVNKHDYYRCKDYICKDLKEHVMKITNSQRLKMISLTKIQLKNLIINIINKTLLYM